MDKDSFWQEVIAMAKHHKENSRTVEHLPEEQMARLESKVYAHIDQLFDESETSPATAISDVESTADSQCRSSAKQRNSLWAWLLQNNRAPIFGLAVFTLLSVGVLGYLFSDNHLSEPRFNIPQSVVLADVGRYIEVPQQSLRALVGTLPSDRRSAFLAGVTQADLDLIGDVDSPAAHQVALWYHHATTNDDSRDALNTLKTVQSNVARYAANEQTIIWFKHGYSVEVVHLAAKQSMTSLNVGALKDALQFYRAHALMPELSKTEPVDADAELINHSDDVAEQYIRNHQMIVDATPARSPTPEQLQEFVDMTRDMKILIQ